MLTLSTYWKSQFFNLLILLYRILSLLDITADFSAVYRYMRSFRHDSTERLPIITVFYLKYPTEIKAHILKFTLMIIA